jgi:hypothetical protein
MNDTIAHELILFQHAERTSLGLSEPLSMLPYCNCERREMAASPK